MDRRERGDSPVTALLAAMQGLKSELWTATPGIIQDFNPSDRTCTIQPAIQMQWQKPDGSKEWTALPLLVDCPVFFPGGGGCVLTFPLKQGDECLVIFANRCIDQWWQSGEVSVQAEFRMLDLSDGFCLPGVTSRPNVQSNINTSCVELRTDDGEAYLRIDPSSHQVDVTTPGPAKITAATVDVTASVINIYGKLVINGIPYMDHQHLNVQPGTGISGPPVPSISGQDAVFSYV
jgi:hypothetical protein